MASKKLSILFTKDGFSFCVFKNGELSHVDTERFTQNELSLWDNLQNAFQANLYFQQPYDEVKVAYLGNQFNLVPNVYFQENTNAQKWLEFNAKMHKGDNVFATKSKHLPTTLVYSYPNEILVLTKEKFGVDTVSHASQIFIDSIQVETNEPQVFLNIHDNAMEIIAFKDTQLVLFNIFATETKEDVVYYVLNVLKQIDFNPNEVNLYYFGWMHDDQSLKMLMNFVRHVMPATADKQLMQNYTLIQNLA